nr:glutamate synthase-related protein [Burkholderia ubonensis]
MSISRCVEAGIGAVVTKSIVDYRRSDMPYIPRRAFRHPGGQWSIQGSFASETLTLDEGVALLREIGEQTTVPVIASVGVPGGPADRTVNACCRLAEQGASMIHLDLFYMPQPRATDCALDEVRALLESLKKCCPLPIAIKLNLDYPAHLISAFLSPRIVDAVFLLDSIRVPPPLDNTGFPSIPNLTGGFECSLFGSWQKPLTMQYTRVISTSTNIQICAGGGLQNASDILDALALGASTVQFATQIMIHGSDWIARTTANLARALSERGYDSLDQYRAAMRSQNNGIAPERATPVRAIIDSGTCIDCDVCTRLMFCSFIGYGDGGRPTISSDCYGCGFCIPLCPTQPKAIHLTPEVGKLTVQAEILQRSI